MEEKCDRYDSDTGTFMNESCGSTKVPNASKTGRPAYKAER